MTTRLICIAALCLFAFLGCQKQEPFDHRSMALIPGGTFQMGDASDGEPTALPLHEVTVAPYQIDRCEVSNSLWDTVYSWALARGYKFDVAPRANADMGTERPVSGVSWYEAVKWCNARSEMEGLTPCYSVDGAVYRSGVKVPQCDWTANGYRLPTEAEWERAARGGHGGRRFPWGNAITQKLANYYVISTDGLTNDYPYDKNPSTGFGKWGGNCAPVASYAPNAYGLCDMAGNVSEWCWDWFADYSSGPVVNPRGSDSGSYRVLRGGNWNRSALFCRVAMRANKAPSDSSPAIGFRCVRSPSSDKKPLPSPALKASPAPNPSPQSGQPVSSNTGSLILIPAGMFQMGDSLNRAPECRPVHDVVVSSFKLESYEVTKSLWDDVSAWAVANGYTFDNTGDGKAGDHPVQMINWFDAVKWCNARSEREGRIPCYHVAGEVYKTGRSIPVCDWTANGYRLPTEAEWEKAARGGRTGRRFPLGNTISRADANYQVIPGGLTANSFNYDTGSPSGHHPDYAVGAEPFTSPAGSFLANGFGLFDMSGNVAEWCWDSETPYTDKREKDPKGNDVSPVRSVRGGAWNRGANLNRCSERHAEAPIFAGDAIGFRCAIGGSEIQAADSKHVIFGTVLTWNGELHLVRVEKSAEIEEGMSEAEVWQRACAVQTEEKLTIQEKLKLASPEERRSLSKQLKEKSAQIKGLQIKSTAFTEQTGTLLEYEKAWFELMSSVK